MHRSTRIFAIAFGCTAACLALGGCSGPHPAVLGGDADSVEVRYAGDVATAMPLAAEFCARYERVARLRDPGVDVAIFSCVRQ